MRFFQVTGLKPLSSDQFFRLHAGIGIPWGLKPRSLAALLTPPIAAGFGRRVAVAACRTPPSSPAPPALCPLPSALCPLPSAPCPRPQKKSPEESAQLPGTRIRATHLLTRGSFQAHVADCSELCLRGLKWKILKYYVYCFSVI
jgi:hypothetical protein